MIKFFRKKRKTLIQKKDLTSYLLYALGEVILVMFGILLALQVNTWNENRKLKRAESKAIYNLINEFERNHKDLIRVYNAKKESEKAMRNYLVNLTSQSLTTSELSAIDRPDIGGYTWNSTNPMLNSLLSTGTLDNLKNDSLKFMLTSWNDLVEDYLEQQTMYNQIEIPNLLDFESKSIPSKVMQGDYSLESTREVYMTNSNIATSREMIVSDLAYHNQLISCINRQYIQVMSASDIILTSNQIQKMLRSEIEELAN